MGDLISQIGIACTGCAAIWLVGRKEDWRRWGFVIGLLGQPFWIMTALEHRQWGVLLLSCFYGYAWANGVWNHFIKAKGEE